MRLETTQSRWTALAALLALVAGLGWLDFVTGTEVRSAVFYILPITLTAWWLSRRYVSVIVVASALAWTLAQVSQTESWSGWVVGWNIFAALVIFQFTGLMVSFFRRERDRANAVSRDLQQAMQREAESARTDALTGMPNRRHFLERLQPEIDRSRRDGQPLVILYLDLDNFKKVNDLHGHDAGDEVLRGMAASFQASLRATDIVARMGGDEFTALLWRTSREGATAIAHRLVDAVRASGEKYAGANLGASIGIAWFDRPPLTTSELIHRADAAMYEAKRAGKGQVVFVQAG